MIPAINNSAIILLRTSTGIFVINVDTIIRVQSISNYSKIYFNNGKTLVVAKVLSWFENNLPPHFFLRVHRSHLVGMRYVQEYSNEENGKFILRDNTEIMVSRRKKGTVLRMLGMS